MIERTMKQSPAIVFDLGKVLLDFDYGIAAAKIASLGSVSAEEVKRALNQSPLLLRYEEGLMSGADFFEAVRSATGFRGDIQEFGATFGDIFTPIPAMIQLHGAVRKRNHPTYVFSNTNELAIGHIRRNFPFFNDFDGYIFSYEHRAMKPRVGLYEAVERVTGRVGDAIVYVDDRPENIEAGAARGWQAILHETPEKTWAVMAEKGLVEQPPD